MKSYSHVASVLGILILLIALPITVYLVNNQQDNRQRAQDSAVLYLVPQQKVVGPGETLLVAIKVKANIPYKGIRAQLTYPIGKFKNALIDTRNSKFVIQNEHMATNGLISFESEATEPLKDTSYIATLQLTATQNATAEDITLVTNTSRIVKLDDTLLPTSLAYEESKVEDTTQINTNIFSIFLKNILGIFGL